MKEALFKIHRKGWNVFFCRPDHPGSAEIPVFRAIPGFSAPLFAAVPDVNRQFGHLNTLLLEMGPQNRYLVLDKLTELFIADPDGRLHASVVAESSISTRPRAGGSTIMDAL